MYFKISKNQNLKSLVGRFFNHNTVHVLANHQLIGQNTNLFSITIRFLLKLFFLNYTAFLFSYVYSKQRWAIRNPYGIKAMIFKHCFDQFVLDISVIFSQIYCLSICDQGRGISRTFSWYFAVNFAGKTAKMAGFFEIRANFAGFLLHTSGSFLFKISTTVSKCMNYQLSNKNKKKQTSRNKSNHVILPALK